jgi:hypothetical protein
MCTFYIAIFIGAFMKKNNFYQGLFRVKELIDPETSYKGICITCDNNYASFGLILEFLIVMPSWVMNISF